jgi:hypothetical protein
MKETQSNTIKSIQQPELIDLGTEKNNVFSFTTTLKALRKNIDPELLRHREGWRDRNGSVRTIEYIEWHTVADILDETAPNWAHRVKDIRVLGDFVTVIVAITIGGITREGIGTGSARSEMGIKKAEHDALKRAAVKFGIARELYKREFEAIETDEPAKGKTSVFPEEPVARSISELVTTKQLGMIRAIARELNVDADIECRNLMNCRVSELSRKAASALIDHLQRMAPVEEQIRKAG